ncbi:class I SAM-dependent methyltransferase [Nocardia sp. NPDC050193]
MTAYRPRESLLDFYTHALAARENTCEDLQAPIASEFAQLIGALPLTGRDRTALDIGYGAGAYSIAMAQEGYRVHAVDQVPADLLTATLPDTDWATRIHVVEARIEDYTIPAPLGLLVAKDVLHYLTPQDVQGVVGAGIQASVPGSCHYLHVFTDIRRTSRNGDIVHIDGELGWTAQELAATCTRLYRGWSLDCARGEYVERDRHTGRPHFEATRVTLIARRPQR